RVGRYLLQDLLGQIWKPLGQTGSLSANVIASVLMVGAWGYFLIQGVRDPLGGINSLWPLFGIANQMLAAIALCLATTVILKMALNSRTQTDPDSSVAYSTLPSHAGPRPLGLAAPAFITLIPLIWLLTVTMTAGVQKIWHHDPRIGFLAQAHVLSERTHDLEHGVRNAIERGDPKAIAAADQALRTNRVLRFNNLLDAAVAGVFIG